MMKRRVVFLLAAMLLSLSCSRSQEPEVRLPGKVFYDLMPDGSIWVVGHWKLKAKELGKSQTPFNDTTACRTMNSVSIRCWPATRKCEEYRACISGGLLIALEPIQFDVVSWVQGIVVAKWTAYPEVECVLRINISSKDVEMEYRREPTPGHARIYERWVLE